MVRRLFLIPHLHAHCESQGHQQTSCQIPPNPFISILRPSPNFTILSTAVHPNGTPVIQLSDGLAHSYDAALCAWTKLSEPWWAEGSDAWQGRQRGASTQAGRAPLAALEGAIAKRTNLTLADGRAEKVQPAWWGQQ